MNHLLCALQHVHADVGLSAQEANKRRLMFGPNSLEVDEEVRTLRIANRAYIWWDQLLHLSQESLAWKYIMQFKEPLILMLLGSAVLSVIIGQVSSKCSAFLTFASL